MSQGNPVEYVFNPQIIGKFRFVPTESEFIMKDRIVTGEAKVNGSWNGIGFDIA